MSPWKLVNTRLGTCSLLSLVSNANSAAIALAEKVAGSEEKFVLLMKAKLKEWGITDATIVNASGLNQSIIDGDEENKKKIQKTS